MADGPPEEPRFRPFKRRKRERLREARASASPPPDVAQLDQKATSSATLPELLRRRKALSRRRAGLEFSTESPARDEPVATQIPNATEPDEVTSRFAPQTGQVVDVDGHMMAYIDAEIERRFRPPSPQPSTSATAAEDQPATFDHSVHRQPAALGRIMEIDLGPDVRAKNVAATELARAGMVKAEEPPTRKGRKGRRRRRRNSEDIRRDQIVEDVLKENRLEVEPVFISEAESDDRAEDADERVAEQFRREFLDAQQARRKRQPANPPAKGKDAAAEAKAKGPKLGGSRSARAAMREKLLVKK